MGDGSTTLVERLAGSAHGVVLVLGTGRWPVTHQLQRAEVEIEVAVGDWPSIQRPRRHELVVVEPPPADGAAAVVHCAVQHLHPGGRMVADASTVGSELATRFDLEWVADVEVVGTTVGIWRRTERRTIHDVVADARSRLDRVTEHELAARLAGVERDGRIPTVVDTRTATDRHRFGVIAGSIHVPRTVLEWHLDPANGYRHPSVTSLDQPLVVVCNGGYSSAMAATSLLDLGFTDVTDLIGGMRAWIAAGLPVVAPDHTHLDL